MTDETRFTNVTEELLANAPMLMIMLLALHDSGFHVDDNDLDSIVNSDEYHYVSSFYKSHYITRSSNIPHRWKRAMRVANRIQTKPLAWQNVIMIWP